MIEQEFLKKLSVKTDTKIVMLVMDGLGGCQNESGETEIETAKHPNLDNLAKISICGLSDPVSPGITPGSGPSHLALFGYDPLKYEIGRGLLDTLGIDFEFTADDLAARGNFCTVNEKGVITDRRAGRIPTEKNIEICKKLDGMEIDSVKIFVKTVKEHRFSVIFRGKNLSDKLQDSDPQKEGLEPLDVIVTEKSAEPSAKIVNKFVQKVKEVLKDEKPANMVLLRGFSKMVALPKFQDIYKLTPACIAIYPMYKGLAQLCGMEVIKSGDTIETEFATLKENFSKYDFFYVHIKQTDSSGEDGDFNRKVRVIEQVDKSIPILTGLNPDVIIITGDHSTPAVIGAHSWHSVPVLIYSKKCRFDKVEKFSETEFISGGLGRILARDIMPIALSNAGKLLKYGA
ncbi:MAG: 2,3-bisphosphoglycerate-independent phosphoglycerate mutase [Elusimicrobia bacterium]|nr:2,3-bisphosphoglycerate-independent phosphoglycerate mutase [Elusimicrobiota bacterium]